MQERAGEPEDTLWLRDTFLQVGSHSGETVTVDRALSLDTVMGCVRVLADSVGALPLRVYRRAGDSMSEEWSAPVSRLLRDEPNPEMTAVDVWGLVVAWLALQGNAYLGKQRVNGEVVALWPIHPDRVRVGREQGRRVYYIRGEDSATERRYQDRDIVHIRGLSIDGLMGVSVIRYARHAIGAGLAMDAYQGSFYRNDATPRGTLNVAGKLTEERKGALARAWRALFGGPRESHKVAVLEDGVTFTPISVSLDDAQFVESQRMTAQKVCRIFRVPPEMVGLDSGNSLTYSTVEGQGIQFERYTIRPWLARIEQALNRDQDLFPGPTRGVFCEFDTQHLLRADLKTRYEAYAMALDPAKGWLSRAEVRQWERMPSAEEDAGDMDTERQRQLELAGLAGLAGQRLGLAKNYGVMHAEEARSLLGLEGDPPPDPAGPPPVEPDTQEVQADA